MPLPAVSRRPGQDRRDAPGHDGRAICARLAFACSAFLTVCAAARAETPGKPYAPVAAVFDRTAAGDADLGSLLNVLRAAAQSHNGAALEAALAPNFVALDCAASPLKACGPGKTKTIGARGGRSIDRMRLAFCCEGKPSPDMPPDAQNDTMFAILGATLAAPSIGANPDAKGQVCMPALPRFDRALAAKAAKAAGVEPENLRIAAAETPLLGRPAKNAPPIANLAAGDLAPVVTDLTADTPPGWTAIGLPDGAIGYTDALTLDELTPAAICFSRDKGQWRIVATILRNS